MQSERKHVFFRIDNQIEFINKLNVESPKEGKVHRTKRTKYVVQTYEVEDKCSIICDACSPKRRKDNVK